MVKFIVPTSAALKVERVKSALALLARQTASEAARQTASEANYNTDLNDLADLLYVTCVKAGVPQDLLPQ
jgi:predicted HAD superfamily Cof-like phosphohydrolase